MRVKWLRQALRNLDQEAEFIADNNPQAAAALVETVLASVERLADHPALGRAGRVPGTRELVIHGFPYLVPYRVKHDAVEVLRVFHTSRQPPKRW